MSNPITWLFSVALLSSCALFGPGQAFSSPSKEGSTPDPSSLVSAAELAPPFQGELVRVARAPDAPLTPFRTVETLRGRLPEPLQPAAWLENPRSGSRFPVYLQTPDRGKGPVPTLVVAPAGLLSGNLALRRWGPEFLRVGFAVVTFDPQGRGSAQGEEDFGGTVSQDALAAVLAWAATRSELDPERTGVFSGSFGVTMAAGALARYPTQARFLLDWEGPPSREYVGCKVYHAQPGRMGWGGCDDESWWRQREAIRFIERLRVPYWRAQTEVGHVQPGPEPAFQMLQAARKGGVPMVGVNHMEPDPQLGSVRDIVLIPETADEARELARIAKALMERLSGRKLREEAAE